MGIPFLVQAHRLNHNYINVQLIGIVLIAFALVIGDSIDAFRRLQPRKPEKIIDSGLIYPSIALFALIVWTWHLISMPAVPLFEELKTGVEDPMLREKAGKLLNIPSFVKYGANFSLSVMPAFFWIGWRKGARFLPIVFALLAALFAKVTTAKGPIIIFAVGMVFVGGGILWQNHRRICIFSILTCLVIFFFGTISVLTDEDFSPFSTKVKDQVALTRLETFRMSDGIPVSFGDLHRLRVREPEYVFGALPKRKFATFVYRVFVVPSEVAHLWYIYFPDKYGQRLGMYGLSASTREQPGFHHPSNTLGIWAYKRRFPAQYGDSVHAYSAVDSDSYARWGYLGLALTAIAVLIIRLTFSYPRRDSNQQDLLRRAGIVTFGIMLPAASLPALLFAHGLILYPLLLLFNRTSSDGYRLLFQFAKKMLPTVTKVNL